MTLSAAIMKKGLDSRPFLPDVIPALAADARRRLALLILFQLAAQLRPTARCGGRPSACEPFLYPSVFGSSDPAATEKNGYVLALLRLYGIGIEIREWGPPGVKFKILPPAYLFASVCGALPFPRSRRRHA